MSVLVFVIDEDAAAPLELGLLRICSREALRIREVAVGDAVSGDLDESLTGEQNLVGVLRFDRSSECPILVDELRQLIAVELVVPGLFRPIAERGEKDRLRKVDRSAAATTAATEPSATGRRTVLVWF